MFKFYGFGNRLKISIKESGFSQKEIATMIGINQDTITNYVKGNIPRADVLYNICQITKCSMEWVLTGKDHPRPISNENTDSIDICELIDKKLATFSTEELINITKRMEEIINHKKLTPDSVCFATGLSNEELNYYFQHKRIPTSRVLFRFYKAVSCSLDWLLTGDTSKCSINDTYCFPSNSKGSLSKLDIDLIGEFKKLSTMNQELVRSVISLATQVDNDLDKSDDSKRIYPSSTDLAK